MKKKKLDFLVIGTQKGGTSALDYFFRNHPEIQMPQKKELHFFDNEKKFSKKWISYRELHKQFDFSKSNVIRGEVTPIYTYWEPSIRRIWNYNKDIKIIVILRNPIDRAFSHWNMEFGKGKEKKDFTYCIEKEMIRSKVALPDQHRVYSYVDRGFYSEQIRRIYRYFNENQVLFIKQDDFKNNHDLVLLETFKFLNIDKSIKVKKKIVHKREYNTTMTKDNREFLYSIYKNDILEVERLLNWNCSDWKL